MSFFRKLLPFVEKNSGQKVHQPTNLRMPDQTERIRAIIRHEMFRSTVDSSKESFDDANDFELPDGEEWVSPYEDVFEPDLPETISNGVNPTDPAPEPASNTPPPADP